MTRPAGDLGRDLGQALGDILVAEAVEAVAADAFVVEGARQCVAVGVRRMVSVEGGVEAGDLRHLGRDLHREADRREIVRLVQRRERLVAGEPAEDALVDPHRMVELGPPVNDTVADSPKLEAFERRQPGAGLGDRRGQVGNLGRLIAALDDPGAGAVGRTQAGPDADAVDLPAQAPFERALSDLEDLELQARRAGVDDEDRVHVRRGRRSYCGARWRRSPRPRWRRGGCGRCRRAT